MGLLTGPLTDLKSIGLRLMELKSTDLKLPEIDMATAINISLPLLVIIFFYLRNCLRKKREEKAHDNKEVAKLRIENDEQHERDVAAMKKDRGWSG